MTRRTAALAAILATALAAPAGAAAEDQAWSVSTASAVGAFRVDATCAFGLVLPGRPNSFQAAGVATAPGALSTTVTCYASDPRSATTAGPVSALAARELWESIDMFCVSAVATFATGTVSAPKACVTP